LPDHLFSAQDGFYIAAPIAETVVPSQIEKPELVEESFQLQPLSRNFDFDASNSFFANDINTRIIVYDFMNVFKYSNFPSEKVALFYPLNSDHEGIFLQLKTTIGSNNYHLFLKDNNILQLSYLSSSLRNNPDLVLIKDHNRSAQQIPVNSDNEQKYFEFYNTFLQLIERPQYENEQ